MSDPSLNPQQIPTPQRRGSRLLTALVTVLATLAALVLVAPPAMAATTFGHQGPAYSGVANPPTSDKPQSKLWFNDGSWWATMWTSGKGWDIWRLDRGTESWVDTGVTTDTRSTALTDTLWDGTHLYVAAQYATVSTISAPVLGKTGNPAMLYRYTYANGTYSRDSGFPVSINNISSETLTIDEDSTGRIWASWVQITGTTSAPVATVYYNSSAIGGTGWGTPTQVPGSAHPSADDISATIAFKGKIGVMFSDETNGNVYFAVHPDTAVPSASWSILTAASGTNQADDHMNLKTVQSDSSGRVYAVLKTSLDVTYGINSTQPGIVMVTYTPGASPAFQLSTVSRIVDCETRPQLILDNQNNQVHVVVTGPGTGTSATSCPGSGTPGAIYEKTASLGATQSWGSPGRGTPIIQDGTSAQVNNPTTTKQTVNNSSGFVVLASNDSTKRYWFSDETLGSVVKPVASFTYTPSSGAAPLAVSFTDTSTNSPTQWSWSFGDGSTSTLQSPTHSYTTAGTYTVTLTASNAAGSSTSTQTSTVTVTGGGGGTGTVTVGASAKATASTAGTAVTIAKPTGLVNGDVLVAHINADANPSITAPSGWTAVTAPLTDSTFARVFSYYKVVTTASSEPSSYTFTLSAAEKWNGGITDFHGVDTATVWDTAVATKVSTTSVSTLAVPSVTTVTPGAMLVGGDGVNSTTATLTPPSGWTEAWEGDGGQDTDFGYKALPTAGATGTSTFTHSTSVSGAAWVRALKPAGSGGTGTAPTASFTEDKTSGTAPLTVQFTDTSTGTPTSWAWDFGDGTSSTSQNPSHTFAAGSSTVKLVATNATGSSTNTASVVITATAAGSAPTASFTEDKTSGTAPLTVQFTDTSTGTPTSWAWDFGDGTSSTSQNPSHTFAAGSSTVKLVATNATGSSTNTASVVITATAAGSAPTASFTEDKTSGTAPLTVQFTDTSTGTPTSWAWDFGDGTSSTSQNPSHTFAAGSSTVKLVATNATGSSTNTASVVITATAAGSAPTASFTEDKTSGTAPLTVQFTDTSTGTPTSWAWDFGDGGTSTSQNPSHTFAAGSSTVKLVATNATGSSTNTASVVITATTGGGGGSITVGASTTGTSTSSVTGVTVAEPSGVVTGDVLVANINANGAPSMATVPTGWTKVTDPVADGTVTTVFSYYHVVTGTEPASWTFTLGTAAKWNAGITDFKGVDTTTVWDTAAATQVSTAGSTPQTVPSVTTVTPGAMLIGGNGVNSSTITIGQPSGWTEAWEADGGKDIDLAYKVFPAAGATGTSTFTHSGSISGSAWVRALKPA